MEENIAKIRDYVVRQINHYRIMRNHECNSRFDAELFEGQEEVAQDILAYIDLIVPEIAQRSPRRQEKAKSEYL